MFSSYQRIWRERGLGVLMRRLASDLYSTRTSLVYHRSIVAPPPFLTIDYAEFLVARLRREDDDSLNELVSLWPEEMPYYKPQFLRQMFLSRLNEDHWCYLLRHKDRLCGSAWLSPYKPSQSGIPGEFGRCRVVQNIFITAAQRGGGLGSILLVSMIQDAYQQELTGLISLIQLDRQQSVKLHEKNGFVRLGILRKVNRLRRSATYFNQLHSPISKV